MAEVREKVYVKADRNTEVTKRDVTIGDVVKIECTNPVVLTRIKSMKLLKFRDSQEKNKDRVAVSIMKVIARIHEEFPHMDIVNLGEADFIADFLRVAKNVFRQLGTGFSILACVGGILNLLHTILLVYFSICIGQLCGKHKIWGSIGAYFGISFSINMLVSIVGLVAGVIGNGGLLYLYTENIYGILYDLFLLLLCLGYFFGGSWLLENRANLE